MTRFFISWILDFRIFSCVNRSYSVFSPISLLIDKLFPFKLAEKKLFSSFYNFWLVNEKF